MASNKCNTTADRSVCQENDTKRGFLIVQACYKEELIKIWKNKNMVILLRRLVYSK